MRKILAAALIILFGCLLSQADSATLVPDSTVALGGFGWSGSGAGDCALSTTYGCINNGVDTPVNGEWILGQSPDDDGLLWEGSFGNSPGDCGSINSVTLRVRMTASTSAEDNLNVWLEVSGTQSGATKTVDDGWSGSADCDAAPTTNCSFTDSTWDTLSCANVDNLTVNFDPVTNNQGMPDTTSYTIIETEIVLDYNVAGAAPTIKKRMVVLE